jgi:hypothetical protein
MRALSGEKVCHLEESALGARDENEPNGEAAPERVRGLRPARSNGTAPRGDRGGRRVTEEADG